MTREGPGAQGVLVQARRFDHACAGGGVQCAWDALGGEHVGVEFL